MTIILDSTTPTSASKAPPPLLGATTAPSVGPPDLPASHAEEDGMDVPTCRKRCRDDVSDDDDAPGPPRKTAASDDDPAAEGHLEACDDIAGSLPIPPCEPEPALSPTYHGGSFSASDSVPPANPATEVAVDLAELPADDPGPAEPAPRCPSPKPLAPREPLRAADYLRDTPAAPPAAKSGKKSKKTQKRRRVPAPPAPFPDTSAAPAAVPAAPATVQQPDIPATAPTYLPAAAEEGDFIEVLSKIARRRAKAAAPASCPAALS
ncbi:hypothetical protein HPB50_010454 [Hyalomma asiaticum]|uniref:Uncharacterized protein n=1 Tax=Hyalomma asiaticum TaxID=266040 RepID=A0ACB7TM06_HYAAI|nr:hypothetical protein HPB50_010454 [Hyalomma asiaticum]